MHLVIRIQYIVSFHITYRNLFRQEIISLSKMNHVFCKTSTCETACSQYKVRHLDMQINVTRRVLTPESGHFEPKPIPESLVAGC